MFLSAVGDVSVNETLTGAFMSPGSSVLVKEILMFLLHFFTERPLSDPHFLYLLPVGLLHPIGPPALCPFLPSSFSLLAFLLSNPHVLLFYLYYRISQTIRRTFFAEKCDLKSTCVLYAEGKYLFPNL